MDPFRFEVRSLIGQKKLFHVRATDIPAQNERYAPRICLFTVRN